MSTYSTEDLQALHPTTRYAVEIVSGLRPSCKREWQACERHLKDLKRQGTEEFPFVFDETRADRIFDWFEKCCRHVRGPMSGELIKLVPFQFFDLGNIFGWVHIETGARRFKKSFNMRARGNVKSTEMSGIGLYGMAGDCIYPPGRPDLRQYESSPEVECAAVDRGQAKRVWGDAKLMAEGSPDIRKRLDIKETYIRHKSRGGFIRPLSKDTKNKDSGASCWVILDEYHAHRTSLIHDTLFSGFGKRWQSHMAIITTAGVDAENSPAKKEYDICCKILDGEIEDETYFIMLRELDNGDDPHDKTNWVKANPILQDDNEYSRGLREQVETEYNLAYGSGDPAKIREFLIKRMDLWQTDSEDKYMTGCMDKFKKLAVSKEEFFRLTHKSDVWLGLDLSKTTDLTATGYVARLPDGRFAVTAHGFMPEERAQQHEHSDRVPYKHWAKEGWCTLTEGSVTDYRYIKTHIHDCELDNGWNILEVCYDPYNATHFTQELEAEGYDRVEIRQGVMTLSEPTKFFRELVLKGLLVHDGSPLLTWCVSNAIEVQDNNGNIKLSKKHKDDSQRIDLLAAIINGMVRAMHGEDYKVDPNKYAEDDILDKMGW